MLSVEQINLLQGQNEGLKKQNAELQKENVELKAENERLKEENFNFEEIIKLCRCEQYQQTLQEIKKIAERQLLVTNVKTYQMVYYADFSEYRNEILQKLNKAEEE